MSERKPPGPIPKDHALWISYAREVAPLHRKDAPPVSDEAARKPQKEAADTRRSAQSAPPQRPTAPTGLDRKTRQKVTRGRMAIEATIDLHGMRQAEAHQALVRFIKASSAAGRGIVLVITGKGRTPGTDEPWWQARESGVLRRLVPDWLRQADLSPLVVGYEPAARNHGGDGAFYVRLRRRR